MRGVLDDDGVLGAAGRWLSLDGAGEGVGVLAPPGRILNATLTC